MPKNILGIRFAIPSGMAFIAAELMTTFGPKSRPRIRHPFGDGLHCSVVDSAAIGLDTTKFAIPSGMAFIAAVSGHPYLARTR